MGVIERGVEYMGFPGPLGMGLELSRLPILLRVRTCRGREQKDLMNEQLGHSGPESWNIVRDSEGQSGKLGAVEEAIRSKSPGVVAIEVMEAGYLLKRIPGDLGSSVSYILRNFRQVTLNSIWRDYIVVLLFSYLIGKSRTYFILCNNQLFMKSS